ncbi:hypothetical protein [Algoriphagus chordae]|uniref:Uncharacterized protein n=1 Tax=Algoriphagus chordae TaxID=237019 RepID=A0A2W7R1H1_9BACT|nr:hypothetical protein [Algoriphagus chordae]PZX54031.1 hypothetical protein LV85_01370 [Algoriphagus chordae]
MINPNIKCRRLVYLKLVCSFANEDTCLKKGFASRFFEFLFKKKEELSLYQELNGSILFNNGVKSSTPYIHLATQIGFLSISDGNKYNLNIEFHNFFSDDKAVLSTKDKSNLLLIIWKADALYFYLVATALSREKSNYDDIKRDFEALILELVSVVNHNSETYGILERVIQKTNSSIAFDSFFLTRANWLKDLGFVKIEEKKIGSGFLSHLEFHPSHELNKLLNQIDSKHSWQEILDTDQILPSLTFNYEFI